MNVSELLQFQPEKPTFGGKKRRRPQEKIKDMPEYDFTKKRSAPQPTAVEQQPKEEGSGISEDQRRKIMELVEDTPEGEPLNETSLKRLILQLEKRVYRNQEMRIKFPDQPQKFMESEMELNDTIHELHTLAASPELYHVLVELNAVQTLLQLLAHDNSDISIAVVDLLQELTDTDALTDSDDAAEALIDALMEGQAVALLVQNMERLDEGVKEESDAVHNTLGIVENVSELKPSLCTEAAKQGLMTWLLKRIKAKIPFDGNKLYCSEVMAILLQNNPDTRKMLGDQDGIDVLLQQLSIYKRNEPSSPEEAELMENLFNCLCSVLMLAGNRGRFLRGEGLQLMVLLLKEKKSSRFSAIKVLDHALSGKEGGECCQKLVEILGLRQVFPLLMKTPKPHKKQSGPAPSEVEEHVVSITTSLLRNCSGAQKQRVLTKFTENDMEKVERLLELHFKYMDRVRVVDVDIERERRDIQKYGGEVEEEQEDGFYLRRLDAGLFTLQLIDLSLLQICSALSPVKKRVQDILTMRGGSVKAIRSIIREYAGNIGDAGDTAGAREAEQERILGLLDAVKF